MQQLVAIKKTLGHTMVEQACSLYPQIRDHIDYVDIGTPVTNAYYIAAPHGEIYGLDHTKTRMSPEVRFLLIWSKLSKSFNPTLTDVYI